MNIHQLDQMDAMLRDIAGLVRNYHEKLVKAGFTDEQAFELVKDYHKSIHSVRKRG